MGFDAIREDGEMRLRRCIFPAYGGRKRLWTRAKACVVWSDGRDGWTYPLLFCCCFLRLFLSCFFYDVCIEWDGFLIVVERRGICSWFVVGNEWSGWREAVCEDGERGGKRGWEEEKSGGEEYNLYKTNSQKSENQRTEWKKLKLKSSGWCVLWSGFWITFPRSSGDDGLWLFFSWWLCMIKDRLLLWVGRLREIKEEVLRAVWKSWCWERGERGLVVSRPFHASLISIFDEYYFHPPVLSLLICLSS